MRQRCFHTEIFLWEPIVTRRPRMKMTFTNSIRDLQICNRHKVTCKPRMSETPLAAGNQSTSSVMRWACTGLIWDSRVTVRIIFFIWQPGLRLRIRSPKEACDDLDRGGERGWRRRLLECCFGFDALRLGLRFGSRVRDCLLCCSLGCLLAGFGHLLSDYVWIKFCWCAAKTWAAVLFVAR